MKNHKEIKYFLTEEEFIKDNLKLSEYYHFNMNYWNRFIVNGFKVDPKAHGAYISTSRS